MYSYVSCFSSGVSLDCSLRCTRTSVPDPRSPVRRDESDRDWGPGLAPNQNCDAVGDLGSPMTSLVSMLSVTVRVLLTSYDKSIVSLGKFLLLPSMVCSLTLPVFLLVQDSFLTQTRLPFLNLLSHPLSLPVEPFTPSLSSVVPRVSFLTLTATYLYLWL